MITFNICYNSTHLELFSLMCPDTDYLPHPASCRGFTPLPFSSSSNSITSHNNVGQLIYVCKVMINITVIGTAGLEWPKKERKRKQEAVHLDWQAYPSWQLVGKLWVHNVKTDSAGRSDQWNIWFRWLCVLDCSSSQLGGFNLLYGNNWEAVRELIVFSTDESSGSIAPPSPPCTHTHTNIHGQAGIHAHTQTTHILYTCTLCVHIHRSRVRQTVNNTHLKKTRAHEPLSFLSFSFSASLTLSDTLFYPFQKIKKPISKALTAAITTLGTGERRNPRLSSSKRRISLSLSPGWERRMWGVFGVLLMW